MIFEKVVAIIGEQLGVDPDTITTESEVIEDLGADSLDIVTLLMCCEDEFGLTIEDDEAQNFRTVGDIVTYIENNQ